MHKWKIDANQSNPEVYAYKLADRANKDQFISGCNETQRYLHVIDPIYVGKYVLDLENYLCLERTSPSPFFLSLSAQTDLRLETTRARHDDGRSTFAKA